MCDITLDDLIIDEYYSVCAAPAAWGGEDLFDCHKEVEGRLYIAFADHPAWEGIAMLLTDYQNAEMARKVAERQRQIDDCANLQQDAAAGNEFAVQRLNIILSMSKATRRPRC